MSYLAAIPLCPLYAGPGEDPERVDEILMGWPVSGPEEARERIRETGEAMGVRDPESSEHILDKLKLSKVTYTKDGGYLKVTYSGKRLRGKTTTQNSEIAFINEFGKRGQPARPFMKTALDKSADEISQAGADKLSAWQDKIFEK